MINFYPILGGEDFLRFPAVRPAVPGGNGCGPEGGV